MSNFEFSLILLRRKSDSPRQFCHVEVCAPRSIQYLTKNFCIGNHHAILQVWMNGFRAFLDELFAASLDPFSTFCVVQKVHVWHRDCFSSQQYSSGLRRRRGCSFRTLLVSAKIQIFFHNCKRQRRIPNKY